MTETLPRVLLIGPPGAGKGTQAQKLSEHFDVPHLSAGDLLRAEVEQETKAGKEAKPYLDEGKLVPEKIVVEIMLKNMFWDNPKTGFVVDGFPRNIGQFNQMQSHLKEHDETLDCVVNLQLSEEEVFRRLTGRRVCGECNTNFHTEFRPPEEPGTCDQCGGALKQRDDDTPETIEERLEVFENESKPVSERFEKEGIQVNVDASGTIEQVFQEIRRRVERSQ